MSKEKCIKIELTPEQRKQIKEASGDDFSCFEFSVEELEKRVAPLTVKFN
jgi:hypothetical protein